MAGELKGKEEIQQDILHRNGVAGEAHFRPHHFQSFHLQAGPIPHIQQGMLFEAACQPQI